MALVSLFTASSSLFSSLFPRLLLVLPPQAAPPLATSIRDVTVYPAEALVTRAGKVAVQRGVTHVEVPGLPAGLRDESVGVRASAGVSVVGVDVLAATNPSSPSKAVEELRAARHAKQRETNENEDRIAVQTSLRAYLDSLRAEAPKVFGQGALAAPDPSKWEDGLKFLAKAMESSAQELRKMQDRKVQLEAELKALDQRLEQLQAGTLVPTKTIALDLVADGASEAEVEVSYLVGSVGWSPAYDLRSASDLKSAKLLVNGVITQRTGEDWSGVNLILSTAKPDRGAEPPRLQPIELALRDLRLKGRPTAGEAAKAEEKEKDGAERRSLNDFARAAPAAPVPRDAEVSSSGLSTQLRVPRPESIPADGRPHRIRVSEVSINLEPTHRSVPKLATRAIVKSKVANPAPFAILAGSAQVFVGNDFVGRITLPEVPSGEKFDLYLGADPGIVVERKQEKPAREAPGFLSSRVKWTYSVRITAKNVSAATGEATLEIEDQIPVSRDDRIKVEIEKCDPPFLQGPQEKDVDRERETQGILRWRLRVKPGEEKVIALVFTVTQPEDQTILGLER
jgi:uncharacterized protein (TIGR02231 family)